MTEQMKAQATLSQEKQEIVNSIIKELENGDGIWQPSWCQNGVPESGATGKKYRGVNNFILTCVANEKGYQDNRWYTYLQLHARGYSFKKDEGGKSMGTGAGVPIEFFELKDKKTKDRFTKESIKDLSHFEQVKYISENVYPVKRMFVVYNADILVGVPQREKKEYSPDDRNERADFLLEYWNEHESKIRYDSSSAYYLPAKDVIHVPKQEEFFSRADLYSTVFHEMGHSTGHPNRLNRDIKGTYGSEEYAMEELRAEIASMFMEQELGVIAPYTHRQNNLHYLRFWCEKIKDNPDFLFEAIKDAEKISSYILAKEKVHSTCTYSIEEVLDGEFISHFKFYYANEYGEIVENALPETPTRSKMLKNISANKHKSFLKNKILEEVSMAKLQELSRTLGKQKTLTFSSDRYLSPTTMREAKKDLPQKEVEPITKLEDKLFYDKIANSLFGQSFEKLFRGEPLFQKTEENERSLLIRLALSSRGDQDLVERIFSKSALYDESKKAHYKTLITESMNCARGLLGAGATKEQTQEQNVEERDKS